MPLFMILNGYSKYTFTFFVSTEEVKENNYNIYSLVPLRLIKICHAGHTPMTLQLYTIIQGQRLLN